LVVVDRDQKYGETYLVIYSDEAKEIIMKDILEAQDALQKQLRAEMK
jgi:ribosome-binding factor A